MEKKNIIHIFILALLPLLIPLTVMQFSDEWDWNFFHFLLSFIFLFGSGLAYETIIRKSSKTIYKSAIILTLATTLFLFWINGAVGIIGSENNPANLMYAGVIAIVIIGSIISRFNPYRMTRILVVVAFAQILVPIIALIIWRPQIDLGFFGVLILNSFFVVMFLVSASLFRRVK